MRVLGIDCGTERTGYGVIDSDGVRHQMVAAGVVRTMARDPLSERLLTITRALREVIAAHKPDAAAVEEVFASVNSKTVIKLAHVRGIAMLTIAEAGLSLGEYSPAEVKTSVAGYGRAEKVQVQRMVHTLLRLDREIESQDACDAVAVAICHATRASLQMKIGAAR